jgi:hypothetical protein
MNKLIHYDLIINVIGVFQQPLLCCNHDFGY